MAKTTDLAEVVTLADGDLGNAVDVSNTSMDATGTNSKFTMANLWAYIKTKADTYYQATGSYLTSANIVGTITNGVTTNAPSEDAVFDALALKAPLISPTFATSITGSYLTASELLGTGASKEVVSLPVATYPSLTELSYVKGVSSAIQTQLNAKLASTDYDDATSAETNTGTSTTKYVSPDGLAGSNFGIRYVQCALNGTTALTTSEKVYFRIPAGLTGMNLVSVTGSVGTGAAGASSSGTPTFTVKNVTDNNQMLSTSLTIDANEYTSATAATAVVIDTTKDDVATDDLIEVAVTTAGTGVTYATVTLGFQLP